MLKKRSQAGDTLIEVLLAFAILGLATIVAIRTMSEGYNRLYSSGQRSQVQAIMNGQLSILQAAHDNEVTAPASSAVWDNIITAIGTSAAIDDPVNPDGCTFSSGKNRMYFNTGLNNDWTSVWHVAAGSTSPAPQDGIPLPDGNRMWIEGQRVQASSGKSYYDFYIKACWYDGGARHQLKTVTRLYEVTEGVAVLPSTVSLATYRTSDISASRTINPSNLIGSVNNALLPLYLRKSDD